MAENEVSEMSRSAVLSEFTRVTGTEEAHNLAACLREALTECSDVRRARIARARTSVRFLVVDPQTGSGAGPVLVCDRPEPSVRVDDGPAEITIHLTVAQAGSYRAGTLQLATSLVSGEVRASGPARKFLVVEPILRSLLAAHADRGRSA